MLVLHKINAHLLLSLLDLPFQVAVLSTAAATLLGAAPAFADYSIFDDLKTSIDTSAKVPSCLQKHFLDIACAARPSISSEVSFLDTIKLDRTCKN